MTNDEGNPKSKSQPNKQPERGHGRPRSSPATFIVLVHAEKRKGAFHEPSEAPPGFGVRQSFRLCGAPKRRSGATAAGALAMEASQPKAPEDWRSPRRYRAIHRLLVPMHAKKTKGSSP